MSGSLSPPYDLLDPARAREMRARLLQSVRANDVVAVEQMLKQGCTAQVDAELGGGTILHHVTSPEMARRLAEPGHRIDLTALDPAGRTAAEAARQGGRAGVADVLTWEERRRGLDPAVLDAPGVSYGDLSPDGAKAMRNRLLRAVRGNDVEEAERLLRRGVPAEVDPEHGGGTILHYAASREMVKNFADPFWRIDPDAKNLAGRTALEEAEGNRHSHAAEALRQEAQRRDSEAEAWKAYRQRFPSSAAPPVTGGATAPSVIAPRVSPAPPAPDAGTRPHAATPALAPPSAARALAPTPPVPAPADDVSTGDRGHWLSAFVNGLAGLLGRHSLAPSQPAPAQNGGTPQHAPPPQSAAGRPPAPARVPPPPAQNMAAAAGLVGMATSALSGNPADYAAHLRSFNRHTAALRDPATAQNNELAAAAIASRTPADMDRYLNSTVALKGGGATTVRDMLSSGNPALMNAAETVISAMALREAAGVGPGLRAVAGQVEAAIRGGQVPPIPGDLSRDAALLLQARRASPVAFAAAEAGPAGVVPAGAAQNFPATPTVPGRGGRAF